MRNNTADHVWAISSSPSSNFVYVEAGTNQLVYGFQIDENTGMLSPIPGSPFTVSANGGLASLAVDRSGKSAYVGTEDGLIVETIGPSTGTLAPTNNKANVFATSITLVQF